MSNWMQDLFHVEKPIIAMCHLQPLPGDPYYDADGGMEKVMEKQPHKGWNKKSQEGRFT